MKTAVLSAVLAAAALAGSCNITNPYTAYSGVNLIGSKTLPAWSPTSASAYMTYENVSAAAAGTSGLPDATAPIYRVEINNLIPNGDFENNNYAAWTPAGAGVYTTPNTGHHLDGYALRFDQNNGDSIYFPFSSLLDSAVNQSIYIIRASIESTSGGALYMEAGVSGSLKQWAPSLTTSIRYEFPDAFTSSISFSDIKTSGSDTFRINYATGDQPQEGYIDNIRIIRGDQDHYLKAELPYSDSTRDGLPLTHGTYRFSVWVKADPTAAATGNRFAADSVTLKIESLGTMKGSMKYMVFPASENGGFSSWTKLYLDSFHQIDEPETGDTAVLYLSVCPGDGSSVLKNDSGSILISSPELYLTGESGF